MKIKRQKTDVPQILSDQTSDVMFTEQDTVSRSSKQVSEKSLASEPFA